MDTSSLSLLILSGNSKRNEEWGGLVSENIGKYFHSSYLLPYSHWKNGGDIDLEAEIEKIKLLSEEFKSGAVFAKSAGTILTAKAVSEGVISPKACIFVGIPYTWGKNNWPIDDWFRSIHVPVLVFQNSGDPTSSFYSIKKMVEEIERNWKVLELEGEDHEYIAWEKMNQEIDIFTKSI